MTGTSCAAAVLARAHRLLPGTCRSVHTAMFVDTRALGTVPDDVCPLGARPVALTGVPRVATAYVWGSHDATVLALHGWGADSTAMTPVVRAATAHGESAMCFDAPGHGISPGRQATITEYARATTEVLQRFPGIHTIVAHSLAALAAISAVTEYGHGRVRNVVLLAPACSLSVVLERWSRQRRLRRPVIDGIYRELADRDGIPVSHWDIRTLGVPASVRLLLLHDPTDDVVPIDDSYAIAAATDTEVARTRPGTGHHGIVGSDEMRAALATCLTASSQ